MVDDFSLAEVQNWMQQMLTGTGLPLNEKNISHASAEQLVHASERLSAEQHLNIYRHSYIARLRACMQSQFSALSFALGPELFESFADRYLEQYPSDNYSLNTLGKNFSIFLKETRPDARGMENDNWPDFMIELADFEYSLSELFDLHAPEISGMTGSATPENCLRVSPLLNLYQHQFPICTYYLHFSQGAEPELPFAEMSYCAVVRSDFKLGLFPIRPAQYFFLKSMQGGSSVQEAQQFLVSEFKNVEIEEIQKIWPEWRRSFLKAGFFIEGGI